MRCSALCALALCAGLNFVPLITHACDGGGSGLRSYVRGLSSVSWTLDPDRHRMGIEYAYASPIFQKEIEGLALKVALAGGHKDTLSVLLELKKEVELALSSSATSLDFEMVNTLVRTALETFLIPYKVKVPGFSETVSLLKLSAAFATAYIYGYLVGK
jgi:hypothetical protein